MQVKLNLLEGAQTQVGSQGVTRTVTAFVSDIPTENPAMVLDLALTAPGVPQYGDPHPADPSCIVYDRIAEPWGCDQARITIRYKLPIPSGGPGGGGGGQPYTIRDGYSLVPVTTGLIPGKALPIEVSLWNVPNARDTVRPQELSYQMPLRTRTILGTVPGDQIQQVGRYAGSVNDKPYGGLPKGYWLFAGFETETLDSGRSYVFSGTIITKTVENWSSQVFFRHDNGRVQKVAEADIQAIRDAEYKHGVILQKSGVGSFGLYPTADFDALFQSLRRR
jgi:hypothetical protein